MELATSVIFVRAVWLHWRMRVHNKRIRFSFQKLAVIKGKLEKLSDQANGITPTKEQLDLFSGGKDAGPATRQ